MIVELSGLRIFGRHGVYPEEKERGQDYLYDVELEVGERGASGRLDDAVDYEQVARCVQEASEKFGSAGDEAVPFVLARAGWTGSQRVSVHVAADAQLDWESLAASVRGALSLGIAWLADRSGS